MKTLLLSFLICGLAQAAVVNYAILRGEVKKVSGEYVEIKEGKYTWKVPKKYYPPGTKFEPQAMVTAHLPFDVYQEIDRTPK